MATPKYPESILLLLEQGYRMVPVVNSCRWYVMQRGCNQVWVNKQTGEVEVSEHNSSIIGTGATHR